MSYPIDDTFFTGSLSMALHGANLLSQENLRNTTTAKDFIVYTLESDLDINNLLTECGLDPTQMRSKIIKKYNDREYAVLYKNESQDIRRVVTHYSNAVVVDEELNKILLRQSEIMQASKDRLLDVVDVFYAIINENVSEINEFIPAEDNILSKFLEKIIIDKRNGIINANSKIIIKENNNESKIESTANNVKGEKQKTIDRVNRYIKSDKENIKGLCLAMSRLAKLELSYLERELPNSSDAIQINSEKKELMKIFADGFDRIASEIAKINKSKNESEAVNSATASVISLSDALNKWWSNKNQKFLDVAIGLPVITGAIVAMRYCGIDPFLQNALAGTAAVSLYGKETVQVAVKIAKSTKNNITNM